MLSLATSFKESDLSSLLPLPYTWLAAAFAFWLSFSYRSASSVDAGSTAGLAISRTAWLLLLDPAELVLDWLGVEELDSWPSGMGVFIVRGFQLFFSDALAE